MITLAVGATVVTLNPDLYWSDEWWEPVGQTETRSITGALIVQTKAKISGRPITLGPIADDTWTLRSALDQLYAWASIPGQQMTLTLRGVARTVIGRREGSGGPMVTAKPVMHWHDVADEDEYLVTLRLLEID